MFILFVSLILGASAVNGDTPESGVLPPPRHGGVYVVAHRGAHQDIPENTLAAYRRAIELGADFVEIDVRTSKDGVLVSVHNSTVDAYTAGTRGAVSDFTLEELKALDIGSRVDPKWASERIPTLDEILGLCRGRIGIYLDLKAADVATVFEAVQAQGMVKDVIWYGGPEVQRYVREHGGLSMPDPGPEANLPSLLATEKPRIVASVWRYFSPNFVTACHDAGAIVIVDESDPDCWEAAVSWGADGIQTDHPARLIEFLQQRTLHP